MFTDTLQDEHDYSLKFEVPLDGIKDQDSEMTGLKIMPPDSDVYKVPVILRDNKPKLRIKKEPKLLKPKLPKPIKPRISVPLLNHDKKSFVPSPHVKPPENCKGVLVVQDVKFCTMYMPKNGHTVASGALPVPLNPLSNGALPLPLNPLSSGALPVPLNPIITHPPPVQPPVPINPQFPLLKQQQSPVSPAGCKVQSTKPTSVTSSVQVQDPPISFTFPKDRVKQLQPTPMLTEVQRLLQEKMPFYWFSALETNGINVMLLSLGKEKAIQRRVFVSSDGSVEISVHCKALPEYFVHNIVEKAGEPVSLSLTENGAEKFSQWILTVLNIVRDFQMCIGVDHPDLFDVGSDAEAVVDKNPYQECTFVETVRSRNCLKLVELRKKRCLECCKLANRRRNQKKKLLIKSGFDMNDKSVPASDCDKSKGGESPGLNVCTIDSFEKEAVPSQNNKISKRVTRKRKQLHVTLQDSDSDA